jgi:hypothetical protein
MTGRSVWRPVRDALNRLPEVVKIAAILAVYYTAAMWVFFHTWATP